MLELVQSILTDRLVLMVTHDPRDAQAFAGRTILIENGVAQKSADTKAIFANPPDGLRNYLGQ